MKIKIKYYNKRCFYYYISIHHYTQEQYDYIFKYLDFDKLDKTWHIYFKNKVTKKWFKKTYMINNEYLNTTIYKKSPLGYEWLKENWGNGIFKMHVYYPDKQELKTIVNRVINVELIRGNNEN